MDRTLVWIFLIWFAAILLIAFIPTQAHSEVIWVEPSLDYLGIL